MKNTIPVIFCIMMLWSCSEDGDVALQEPNFIFQISGAINKTISGNVIVFNETTVDVNDIDGNTTQLTTLLVDARDSNSDDTVTFAITSEASQIGSGNYDIGTDIFSFYNAFLNYSTDNGNTISYQSEGGSISISSKGLGSASGAIDIECIGTNGSITISGTFTAASAN